MPVRRKRPRRPTRRRGPAELDREPLEGVYSLLGLALVPLSLAAALLVTT
jgi:hypothetical protein